MTDTKHPRRKVRPDILNAAIRLFGNRGFHGVNTRDIAREAEVPEQLVYQWFSTKQNLYEEAVNSVLEQVNVEFGRFMVYLFQKNVTGASIARAMHKWQAALPQSCARLMLQVLLSDRHLSPLVNKPLDQMTNAIAHVLAPQGKAKSGSKPLADLRSVLTAMLCWKALDAANQVDKLVQQCLLAIQF